MPAPKDRVFNLIDAVSYYQPALKHHQRSFALIERGADPKVLIEFTKVWRNDLDAIAIAKLTDVPIHYKGLPRQIAALNYLQSNLPRQLLIEATAIWDSERTTVVVGAAKPILTFDQLYKITTTVNSSTIEAHLPGLNSTLKKYRIDTPLRIAHFLSQTLHECGEFQFLEEIASGEDYEGRADLGNTEPGDGVRFKGRGLIQVTGAANYLDLSANTGIDFVGDPKKLATVKYAALGAGWFWDSRNLNSLADSRNHAEISRRVNGVYPANGQDDRDKYLVRACRVLGC